jgi:hypothetical protein
MKFIASLVTWFLSLLIGIAVQAQAPERFDMQVRNDFFAGFAGDMARLQKGLDACERALAENPKHAEALVWHGSGLYFKAGMAFQQGDQKSGIELFTRGIKEMDDAVALAENVGVLIRGAVLLNGTRFMAPEMARPLIEALGDYEKPSPSSRNRAHSPTAIIRRGELLFQRRRCAPRTTRQGAHLLQSTEHAPASGHAPQTKDYLATSEAPKIRNPVGCHVNPRLSATGAASSSGNLIASAVVVRVQRSPCGRQDHRWFVLRHRTAVFHVHRTVRGAVCAAAPWVWQRTHFPVNWIVIAIAMAAMAIVGSLARSRCCSASA